MNKKELINAVMNEVSNMKGLVKTNPLASIRCYCRVPAPIRSADWWAPFGTLESRLDHWVPDNDKLTYTFHYSEGLGDVILSIKGEWV